MDFTHEELKVLQSAIDHYGEESQLDMAIEEMAKLTEAICKYKRLKKTVALDSASTNKKVATWKRFFVELDNIKGEIADVFIMLEQIMMMFDCEERMSAIVSKEIDRLKWRIDNG